MLDHAALFENQPIRRIYDEATETWWFSVVDIIKILTRQPDTLGARTYWKVLKNRLSKEGSQLVTKCNQLKMTAAATGLSENKQAARVGGRIAKGARLELETKNRAQGGKRRKLPATG